MWGAKEGAVLREMGSEFFIEAVWSSIRENGTETTRRDRRLPAREPFTIPWLVGTAFALAVAAVEEEDEACVGFEELLVVGPHVEDPSLYPGIIKLDIAPMFWILGFHLIHGDAKNLAEMLDGLPPVRG